MSNSKNPDEKNYAQVVVQRYRSCQLLINETDWVSVGDNSLGDLKDGETAQDGHCGLLVYISFARDCSFSTVDRTVTAILNLPVLTAGQWGDGSSSTHSLNDQWARTPMTASLVIVPQANLISSLKKKDGSSIQYHDQCSKERGRVLYHYFVNEVYDRFFRNSYGVDQSSLTPKWYSQWINFRTNVNMVTERTPASLDPSIPPSQIFRDATTYSQWNEETGIPISDMDGQPLTKSALKKLHKVYQGHAKRHEKWKLQQNDPDMCEKNMAQSVETDTKNMELTVFPWQEISMDFRAIVFGTFGKRQGVNYQSDMGPFVHQFTVAE